MTEKIGQMDEGYFVPRSDIVRWINHTLQLEMTEVEQLGTGAIYCQLFDSLYPGRVPMGKINWRAKQEYEFIQNFKLLQSVLDRVGIDKKIEVPKLVRCKCQDNLELIQWVKRFIELQGGPEERYDAVGRRGKVFVQLPSTANSKRKVIANKENNMMKRSLMMSTTNLHKIGNYSTTSGKSSARKSDSPDHLDLSSLTKTPIKANLANERRIMSKTQRNPLKSIREEDSNRLNMIRKVIQRPIEERLQLKEIKRLLTSEDILQEEEPDFI